MNRDDSDTKLIFWIISAALTLSCAVLLMAEGKTAPAVIFMTSSLILTTANAVWDKDTPVHKISVILMFAAAAALVLVTGRWYAAASFAVPSLLMMNIRLSIRSLIAFALEAGAFVFAASSSSLTPKRCIIFALILLAFHTALTLSVLFIEKYSRAKAEVGRILRISSLDNLSERQLREQLARNKDLGEENARLEERERISRDIHNSVGHTLSAASVTLDAASLLVGNDPSLASEKIDTANGRVHDAIDSIRKVVRTLDSDDDTVMISDYAASLKQMINEFTMDTDVKVRHNLDGIRDDGRIAMGTAAFLSGALSELLTNGMKHGDATLFVVVLSFDASHIMLKVQDNGRGWGDISYSEKQALLANGFGLRKLRDHARSKGGDMTVEGSDGFMVTIDLPRNAIADKEA